MDMVTERDELSQEGYVPQAVERKKSALMYMGVGLVLGLGQAHRSSYELLHLKVSTGLLSISVLIMVCALPLLLLSAVGLSWVMVLPLLGVVCMTVIAMVCARWAWNGAYGFVKMPIFSLLYNLGHRLLGLFDII